MKLADQAMHSDRNHHTRHRVRLPSGKQIEVVYRDQQQAAAGPPATLSLIHILQFITDQVGAPVTLIGVGPGREQVIWTDAGLHTTLGQDGVAAS